MKIEQLSIDQLVFDSQNARKHSKRNLDAIRGSLDSFGQRKPVVVDYSNVIVAGNGTVEAARSLGWSTVACVRVPKNWTDVEIKAFALADNRTGELAEWNDDILAKQLMDLQEADFDIKTIGFDALGESVEHFQPVQETSRLDEKNKTLCPQCGHEF